MTGHLYIFNHKEYVIKQSGSDVGNIDLENKGIVFKALWFVRPNINTGATIIEVE